MATYLQGQQDYVTQIQPTKPNLQFDAQMLGNLQNKYDAGHKKVSELYGSLLNSAMTRTDNIEARNEFFQMINQDIRRMGSLDFSLQQNVDAAANVFQSIYTNKGIVKDMVWTKNFQNQMSKRDGLKNSNDPDKTGGSAWDIGDRAMAYQREAFRNATADEALAMRNVEYVPQQNMMKDAIKLAKEADLNVTIDKISGKYKITTKNGDLIKSPLTTLFAETFAKDPKYKAMYDTQAYVSREDWTHNRVKMGEAKDLDAAKLDFLKDFQNKQTKQLENSASALDVDMQYLDSKVKDEMADYNAGKFKADSDRGRRLQELQRLQKGAASAKAYTTQLLKAQKATNPDAAYDVLARNIDNQRSYDYMNKDITAAVRTLAFRDAEQTLTPDDFAKLDVQHQNKLAEMKQKFWYDKKLQEQKDAAALERAEISGSGASLAAKSSINTKVNNIAKVKDDFQSGGKYTTKVILNSSLNDPTWKNIAGGSITPPISPDKVTEWRGEGKYEKGDKIPQGLKVGDYKNSYARFHLEIIDRITNEGEDAKRNANNDFLAGNKSGTASQRLTEIPFPKKITKENLDTAVASNISVKGGEYVTNSYVKWVMEQKGLGQGAALEAIKLARREAKDNQPLWEILGPMQVKITTKKK